jgi:hypothetical protein
MNSYLTDDTDALQVFSSALSRVSVHGSVSAQRYQDKT